MVNLSFELIFVHIWPKLKKKMWLKKCCKKCWIKNVFEQIKVQKFFGSKDILVQKDVGTEKGWGPKNFGTKNC